MIIQINNDIINISIPLFLYRQLRLTQGFFL
nr:MAG TPA: hypothetical protein [Caudoviricetes sp.]